MAANTHLLRSLCHDNETFNESQILFRTAQKKTAPGSGFELRSHTTGLPAICAYMASQKLQNNAVSRKSAQAASCLKASDFDKALQIVQAAIGGSRKQIGTNEVYDNLIRRYELFVDRSFLLKWLSGVEETLLQSESDLNPDDPAMGPSVKYAAFYWMYNVYTGKNLATGQREYAEDHAIPPRSFSKLLKQVSTLCAPLKSQIQREALARKSSPTKTPATTPRRSPTKAALRALPSKDSPSKRKAPPPPLPHSDADPATSDVDMLDTLVPDTPTKRPRPASPSKPVLARPSSPHKTLFAFSSQTKYTTLPLQEETLQQSTSVTYDSRPRIAASLDRDPMEVDEESGPAPPSYPQVTTTHYGEEEEEDEGESPPRRRFRPIFLDHKQWYSQDRRIKRVWKEAESYKALRVRGS